MTSRALIVVAGLALASCTHPAGQHRVEYRLTGSAQHASVAMDQPSDNGTQMSVAVPWTTTQTFQSGEPVYLSGEIEDPKGGRLGCAILVDGKPFKTAWSEGDHNSAICSGEVPD